MAMKMDRRAFLKTSAAVAVAVSMTGLLGGCSDGDIGTNFGLFQATAGAASCNTNADGWGNVPATGWEGYINVWVRIKDTTGDKKPQALRAERFFTLKINGQVAGQLVENHTDDGLLSNGGFIQLEKDRLKEGWMCFTLKEDQKALYEAVAAKEAEVTFIIEGARTREDYKLDYETKTFVKQTIPQNKVF